MSLPVSPPAAPSAAWPASGPSRGRLPLVDALKALATQLIVWHHLAFYGPMSDVVHPWAPGLLEALYDHGRLAVQAFLVMGGFLAARSLWPRIEGPTGAGPLHAVALAPSRLPFWSLLWRRYQRLVQPYAVALLLALASAAVARALMQHDATPAAPGWAQLAAHLLLLQGVLGYDGLSAGVWYVAIDFQLFALLLALAWLAQRAAPGGGLGRAPARLAAGLCAALAAASLLWFNRDATLDAWAPYFFGAYGLGVLAARIAARPARDRGLPMLALAALVLLALLLAWRSRIAVAGVTALLLCLHDRLALPAAWRAAGHWWDARVIEPLARVSYAQFLLHYPVALFINALVTHHWPDHAGMNAFGLVYAWGLSLLAAVVFHQQVEQGRWRLHLALGASWVERLALRRLPRPRQG